MGTRISSIRTLASQTVMGCLCSSSATRHDTEWTFENVSRDRLSGAIQRALLRPPKWQLTQYAPAGDNVDMFHGDRRTDTFGFIDNITLRVCYDAPTPGKSTVVAVSHCGNPDHAFDYGQNKRNLNQLKAAIDKELASAKAHAYTSGTEFDLANDDAATNKALGKSLIEQGPLDGSML